MDDINKLLKCLLLLTYLSIYFFIYLLFTNHYFFLFYVSSARFSAIPDVAPFPCARK